MPSGATRLRLTRSKTRSRNPYSMPAIARSPGKFAREGQCDEDSGWQAEGLVDINVELRLHRLGGRVQDGCNQVLLETGLPVGHQLDRGGGVARAENRATDSSGDNVTIVASNEGKWPGQKRKHAEKENGTAEDPARARRDHGAIAVSAEFAGQARSARGIATRKIANAQMTMSNGASISRALLNQVGA